MRFSTNQSRQFLIIIFFLLPKKPQAALLRCGAAVGHLGTAAAGRPSLWWRQHYNLLLGIEGGGADGSVGLQIRKDVRRCHQYLLAARGDVMPATVASNTL